MQAKILTTENYFKCFTFQEQGTGCGILKEPESGEYYFAIETYLPKLFFNLDNHSSILFNPFIKTQLDNLPDQIKIKFELFGIGSMGAHEAYIFKPWAIDINNPILYGFLENFHLFIPSIFFCHLIEFQIFMENLDPNSYKHIRVLQNIASNTFQRFGLDVRNVERTFESSNLKISRIESPNMNEISEFYKKNWEGIPDALQHKYFRPLLNTWFRVSLKSQDKTIGFVRLYNTNSSFTGGTSLEYIIDKHYRNKGYATESSSAVISYLRKYSYAISLGGEVNDNNEYSKKVLKRLGFAEIKSSSPLISDNFYLSLLDTLINIETEFEINKLKLTIQNIYADKYG